MISPSTPELLDIRQPRVRPRFLTIIPHIGLGGAERVVANLLATMRPELFDYHLVTLNVPDGGTEQTLPPYVNRSVLNATRVETAGIALARYLRRLRPDLICSHVVAMNVITSMAVLASGIDSRLVLIDHHVATQSNVGSSNVKGPGLFHPLLRPAMRWAYPRSDRFVGVSSTVLGETQRVVGANRGKGVVIPNPIVRDDLVARSQEPAGHPWLDQAGFEVVLAVGRLVPVKNFHLLINAFALIAERRANARLIIMGIGPLRSELEAQIQRLGLESRAQLIGQKENPFSAMRRARTIAVTSHSEGLSTVLIEAMACGTPVVATQFQSAGEALPSWGGRPVPFTPEAVANAIEQRFDHPEDPQRLKTWATQFAAAPIARRYEQLFLDILAGHANLTNQ